MNGYYDYGYNTGTAVSTGLGAVFGIFVFMWIISIAIGVFSIVCMWKVFKKAGKNGWEAIIPIYNLIVMLEIAGCPMWYIVLFFIPVGNVIVMFLIYIELAKKFGQGTGFGIGLVFLNLIFMAMLAFGKKYVYQGAVNTNQQPVYNQQPQAQQPVQPTVEPVVPVMEQPEQPISQFTFEPVVPVVEQPVQPTVEPVVPVMEQQSVQPTNCSRCGSPVNPGDKFCMNCGNQL